MSTNVIKIITAVLTAFAIMTIAVAISLSSANAQSGEQHYVAHYTSSGEMTLPPNNIWRTWIFVGSPLTPNALNSGNAGFPEYHNVYIQPWAYAAYRTTHEFPEGTIMFKELQLTLPPAQNPDGSRSEASGRGYFPGAFNGADVTVKDSKRYAATGGWGYFDFNHHEPKAAKTAVQPKEMCAFCHLQGAKKDEVWTQFYAILEQ